MLFCKLCGKQIIGKYLPGPNGYIACEQCNQTKLHCVRCALPFNPQQLTTTPNGLFCNDCQQSAPTCDLCHEPLPGRHQIYNGTLKVCPSCERTAPRCARCKIPSYQLTSIRGVSVCPACLRQSPICDLCHQPIPDEYQVYKGTVKVCAGCERTAPRCARCNVPSRQLTPVRDAGVCAECLKEMPLCDCCHTPILGRYNTFEQSPGLYCESCMKTRPRCGICNVPINEQGQILRGSDGETVRCGYCLRTAIKTGQQAQPLYRQMHALLMQKLDLEINVLPPLTLMGRARLAALRREKDAATAANPPPGMEQLETEGFFHRVNDQQNIYIEHYLPQVRFQSVAAHELAHAWQSAHAPHDTSGRMNQPARIIEGFAEWVAYSILQALGKREEAERLAKRDDLYGEGLRYFLDLERRQGRRAVIERAKR